MAYLCIVHGNLFVYSCLEFRLNHGMLIFACYLYVQCHKVSSRWTLLVLSCESKIVESSSYLFFFCKKMPAFYQFPKNFHQPSPSHKSTQVSFWIKKCNSDKRNHFNFLTPYFEMCYFFGFSPVRFISLKGQCDIESQDQDPVLQNRTWWPQKVTF